MTAKRTQPAKPSKPVKKSDRSFISLIAVVLVAGAAIIGYVAFRPGPQATIIDPNAPLPDARGQVLGSETAPVEIVMFADFECPGCARFANITEPDVRTRLVETGLARFVFMDYPLPGHPSTWDAHNAAACAAPQNKFWEMHDRIFQNQAEWSQMATGRNMNAPRVFKGYARDLDMDTGAFNQCLDSRQFETQIRANYNMGSALGVNSTPTFRVGNRLVPGVLPYDMIKALVDSATADALTAPAAAKALGDTAR